MNSIRNLDSLKMLLDSVAEELGEDGIHWNRHLDTLKAFKSLALPLGATILDVGCGFGHLCLAIKRLGYNVIAVDMSIEKFGDRLRKHGIITLRCDVENEPLPFDSENFNCVLFTEVIEHLDPRKLQFALSEIHRVLKAGGTLLLTTPNQASLQNGIRLLLGRKILFSPNHVREYVLQELVELLGKAGFCKISGRYLLAYDKTTSIGNRNAYASYILNGCILHRSKTNIARVLLYPLKLLVPRLRSLILLLAYKDESL